MSREFYDYIASNVLRFFQNKTDSLRMGERYCLKLDTKEMVEGVDLALKELTYQNGIQGKYNYENVYSTFTIKLSEQLEVVIASKTNGMTDDFFTTLRNAELTASRFPILMITYSTIDSIDSGTGNLAANGMPFHVDSIIYQIENDIESAQMSVAERTLLVLELDRKKRDRFSDKSSLFEYAELLTALNKGVVDDNDYPNFSLLPDPEGAVVQDEKKVRNRLEDNYQIFKRIDNVVKYGNINEELEKEFDKPFLSHLVEHKRKHLPWYLNCTYNLVKASQDKLKRRLDNPLQIVDADICAYSNSPLEYLFEPDRSLLIRSDGDSKAKQRRKNVLIYNPDQKETITLEIKTNIAVKQNWIDSIGCKSSISTRKIIASLKPDGCSFSRIDITDPNNNIKFQIRICVINTSPEYLENIQTSYYINVPKNNVKKGKVEVFNINNRLLINPRKNETIEHTIEDNGEYECNYDQSLILSIGEESINPDVGYVNCSIKCGPVVIPVKIQDEKTKIQEITGAKAFKWKFEQKRSLEYRDERIIAGTTEYYTKEAFRNLLTVENLFIEKEWLSIVQTIDGPEELSLSIPDNVRESYLGLVREIRKKRTLPSLAYFQEEILDAATQYVGAVEECFSSLEAGSELSSSINDVLRMGCSFDSYDEHIIAMSPLHPLNVLYQIRLLEEDGVGAVRENLVEKLTPLYLLPFIKDQRKNLYHAIEQGHSPEWRYYAPISNKRFQGARNYVQRLVCEKIKQYKEHFSFLFEDIGNDVMYINLVNMGDCREVFQGVLQFYFQSLSKGQDPEDLLEFVFNIYSEKEGMNEFLLLSDQKKLRKYIEEQYSTEDVSELALIMTEKVRCYYRSSRDSQYQYSHLTFYEMGTTDDPSESRMKSITTGVSMEGLLSGTPSVLNADWYKTGFGLKYADDNRLTRLAAYYNAIYRVAFSGSSYEPGTATFTEIEQDLEGKIGKIYSSSNWVVFVDPKVDLSFFKRGNDPNNDLMIIHYSDQYSSASGYDDITVTQKSDQYSEIINDQLQKKGVMASQENINDIISLFNAVNGGWLLKLITAKKLTGAADSYFSREKMSILSAIKVCMAYYAHSDIVWIPVSLEEMLRISGGVGLSQKDGLLSAKNLGFEQRATSDDILLVGVEGPKEDIKLYLHPVEVKIGLNQTPVMTKANNQVRNTYDGLRNALWPDEGRNALECKLSRNFLIQLLIVCCEKMKLYSIYPDENWDAVLDEYRQNLLNGRYIISSDINELIGEGTVISFATNALNKRGVLENDVCVLEFPEKMGSQYMLLSPSEIEKDLEKDQDELPRRLRRLYFPHDEIVDEETETNEILTGNTDVIDENQESKNTSVATTLGEDAHSDNEHTTEEDDDSSIDNNKAVNLITTGIHVNFGTNLVTGENVYWNPNDTNQVFHTNTGIIGTMGTGKTQFTKSLITQVYCGQDSNIGDKPIGILIFDYKGDYNESKEDFVRSTKAKVLKPYNLPFNPLALTQAKVFKPLLPVHTANAFKDTISKVYGLGPKQQNTLLQCILKAYEMKGIHRNDGDSWGNVPPTFNTVYNIYANDEEIKKGDSLAAALDKLYTFQIFESNPEKTYSLYDLIDGVVVIDLSGYDPDIQSLVVAITLDLFYAQMQAAGSSKLQGQYRQLTKMILVDEADNFMSEGFPALKKILKEGREFGVGTILSTQFLKHFGSSEDDYSKYILTWVVHNVSDLRITDVEFVFNSDARSEENQRLYHDIKSLQKHHSIVKVGNSKPVYILDKAFWQLYKELN